jgi:iron complex outermembrane receptor protein
VNAPKYTVTGAAEYPLALGKAGTFEGRADYIHKSTIQYDYGNSPLIAQDPFGLLNARLTWQPRSSPVSVFLFGTNLTDVHYAVGGIDDSPTGSLGEVVKLIGPPREWGIGLQYRF